MAHADIDPGNPPRRRIGAMVLIRNRHGDVLMVKPKYKHQDSERGWQLPGGGAHPGEAIASAAAREVLEETGLKRHITHLLMVDQVPASDANGSAEGFNFICDGGTLDNDEAESVILPEGARDELSALKWVSLGELDDHALSYQAARVRSAVSAWDHGMRLPLYRHGEPASA